MTPDKRRRSTQTAPAAGADSAGLLPPPRTDSSGAAVTIS